MLAAVLPSRTSEGRYCYDVLCRICDALLVRAEARGAVTADARRCFVVPAYPRSAEELRAPFTTGRLGLRIESLELRALRCPYLAPDSLASVEGRLAFARRYTDSVWAWGGPMIDRLLSDPAERARFREDLVGALAENAEELVEDYFVATLVAHRL